MYYDDIDFNNLINKNEVWRFKKEKYDLLLKQMEEKEDYDK